jgi:hypothetical protein
MYIRPQHQIPIFGRFRRRRIQKEFIQLISHILFPARRWTIISSQSRSARVDIGTYTLSCSSRNLNTLGRLSRIDFRRDWNPLTRLSALRIASGSKGGLRLISRSWISISPRTLDISFSLLGSEQAYWQVCMRAVKPVASGVPGSGGKYPVAVMHLSSLIISAFRTC